MASAHSDHMAQRPVSAKIVISGGFGVGKTTLVGSVSEITPLRTEAAMTTAGLAVDDASQVGAKTTTTVAMDFGKLTVETGLVLYLFGTPGQDRFGFMWDDVVQGALGAIVLVDTRRLDQCYAAVDYFERRELPFVVACNHFDGGELHDLEEVRVALDVPTEVPIFMTDARESKMARDALLELLEHVLTRLEAKESAKTTDFLPPHAPEAMVHTAPPTPEPSVQTAPIPPPPPPAAPAPSEAMVHTAPPAPEASVQTASIPPPPPPPAPAPSRQMPRPLDGSGGSQPEAAGPDRTNPVPASHVPHQVTGWKTEVGPGGIAYFVPKGS